jgi:hypothetical protein
MSEEEQHKEFLLAALRAASARARAIPLDIDTIGIALKGDLIGADTAVAWIREANLMWLVGPIPERVGRVASQNGPEIGTEIMLTGSFDIQQEGGR